LETSSSVLVEASFAVKVSLAAEASSSVIEASSSVVKASVASWGSLTNPLVTAMPYFGA